MFSPTQPLGRVVERRDLDLYRDSPFLETVTRTPLATAYLLFPTLDIRWDAVVVNNVAQFSQAPDETNTVPGGALVELWCDGEVVSAGEVLRYGDLPG